MEPWEKLSADHQKQYKQFLQRADKNKVLKQLPVLHEKAFIYYTVYGYIVYFPQSTKRVYVGLYCQ